MVSLYSIFVNGINLGRFIPFSSLGGFDPPPLARIRPGTLQRLGFPVPRIELGSQPTKGAISYHWTTQEGCSFERYIIGLFRSTVIGLRHGLSAASMCPLRHDDGLSLGGFDPPPPTFVGWHASMTFTLLCGFDPHPPTVVDTHPLRYIDSV